MQNKPVSSVPIACDTGGTFTDFVFFNDKKFQIIKLPSNPINPSSAVLEGIEKIFSLNKGLKNKFIHGMTIAINHYLERKGQHTLLLTSKGFKDIIEIGRQNRLFLYKQASRSTPLVSSDYRIEISERISSSGQVIITLNEVEVKNQLQRIKQEKKIDSIAICFLFSFLNPVHEQKVKLIAQEIFPDVPISISSEVLPHFREYERTVATVLDAYIAPVILTYLRQLKTFAYDYVTDIDIIQSNGGISTINSLSASQCLLSGLAGGVLGARYSGVACQEPNIISLDIGGTSSDVALLENLTIKTVADSSLDNLPIAIPVVDVKTIGAGGGSIVYYDKQKLLQVGPQSQGADPGPSCYSKGGDKVCITDVDLFLGWLRSDNFAGGSIPLDRNNSEKVLLNLRKQSSENIDTLEKIAQAAQEIFHFNIASAIRSISVEKGHDPRDFTLIAFGGAGPTHACSVAEILEISKIIVPPFPGCWSAFGLLTADYRYNYSLAVLQKFDDIDPHQLEKEFMRLEQKGIRQLKSKITKIMTKRYADIRYLGQSFELQCFYEKQTDILPGKHVFEANHMKKYGYIIENEPLEVVNIGVIAIGVVDHPPEDIFKISETKLSAVNKERKMYLENTWMTVPTYTKKNIFAFHTVSGPCLIEQDDSTIIVLKNWVVRPQKATQHLILERI